MDGRSGGDGGYADGDDDSDCGRVGGWGEIWRAGRGVWYIFGNTLLSQTNTNARKNTRSPSVKIYNMRRKKAIETHLSLPSMQILLIQRMHLPRQIWPIQTRRQLRLQPLLILPRPLPRKLHLPPTKVIQQPHIRLDEDREPARPDDEVRVDERQSEVLHDVGDLFHPSNDNQHNELGEQKNS